MSRDVPVSTPVMKAKPLRAPLRERTNNTPAADSSIARGVNETAAGASATNAERATPEPAKAEAAKAAAYEARILALTNELTSLKTKHQTELKLEAAQVMIELQPALLPKPI